MKGGLKGGLKGGITMHTMHTLLIPELYAGMIREGTKPHTVVRTGKMRVRAGDEVCFRAAEAPTEEVRRVRLTAAPVVKCGLQNGVLFVLLETDRQTTAEEKEVLWRLFELEPAGYDARNLPAELCVSLWAYQVKKFVQREGHETTDSFISYYKIPPESKSQGQLLVWDPA